MRPDGGIESVSIPSGEVGWTSAAADKPLGLYGDLLIAQAGPGDEPGRLEVVFLGTQPGDASPLSLFIDLPEGASSSVDDSLGRTFLARAAVRDGVPLVSWDLTERYSGGIAPPPGEPLEHHRLGAYHLDLQTQAVTPVEPTALSVRAPTLPPPVEAWRATSEPSFGPVAVGSTIAATQTRLDTGGARTVLKRWLAASGEALPDVELIAWPRILELPSADGRHLLISERVAPGDAEEYRWSIFSLETGDLLGQLRQSRSHASFLLSGQLLIFVDPPSGHWEGEQWIEEPWQIRAVRLDSSTVLWTRPLRDTAYRGPFPQ